MTGTTRTQFSIWAAFMVASLGTAIAASGAVQAGNDSARCEIAVGNSGGMVAIEALASTRTALSGSYRLAISGPGTSLDQGGEFDARAGETVSLGSAMLAASGRSYDVTLKLLADGIVSQCFERVGPA